MHTRRLETVGLEELAQIDRNRSLPVHIGGRRGWHFNSVESGASGSDNRETKDYDVYDVLHLVANVIALEPAAHHPDAFELSSGSNETARNLLLAERP